MTAPPVGACALLLAAGLLAGCAFPSSPAGSPDAAWPVIVESASGHHGGVDILGEVPADADFILRLCERAAEARACERAALRRVLDAEGTVVAFDVLVAMAERSTAVDEQAHATAHHLGRYAFEVDGDVQRTLAHCSLKITQGCYHGALEAYFSGIEALTAERVSEVCPRDSPFVRFYCTHGVGHGLMLATGYDLDASLALCDGVTPRGLRVSCYHGAFMENVVGYINAQLGRDSHAHAEGEVTYRVDPQDAAYPCNAVEAQHEAACWYQHIRYLLFIDGTTFADVAQRCSGLSAPLNASCFRGLGAETSDRFDRDPNRVSRVCSYASGEDREWCISGYVYSVVLHYVEPERALPICVELPDVDKDVCYFTVGAEAAFVRSPEEAVALCARAESGYEASCLRALEPEER